MNKRENKMLALMSFAASAVGLISVVVLAVEGDNWTAFFFAIAATAFAFQAAMANLQIDALLP